MMSLKTFHLFFIALSTLLAFCFGAWGIQEFVSQDDVSNLVLGAGSIVVGGALVVYGTRVREKLKHLGDVGL